MTKGFDYVVRHVIFPWIKFMGIVLVRFLLVRCASKSN